MLHRVCAVAVSAAVFTQGCVVVGVSKTEHNTDNPTRPAAVSDEAAWVQAEKGLLVRAVQLTDSDRFAKAGESYFSPDDSQIIFQAIEAPPEGQEPDDYYAMYVADVMRSGQR